MLTGRRNLPSNKDSMKFLLLLLLTVFFGNAQAQKEIKLEELKDHIGDSVKVQGRISSARYLESTNNTPTFINVGGVYPNQLLTIVIWGDVRKKMGYDPSDKKNLGGLAVVIGKVELYKDKPQIVITDPSQLRIIVNEVVPDK
jgi:DNA/RNA endonuclease YhcR with UshA esterase domain